LPAIQLHQSNVTLTQTLPLSTFMQLPMCAWMKLHTAVEIW